MDGYFAKKNKNDVLFLITDELYLLHQLKKSLQLMMVLSTNKAAYIHLKKVLVRKKNCQSSRKIIKSPLADTNSNWQLQKFDNIVGKAKQKTRSKLPTEEHTIHHRLGSRKVGMLWTDFRGRNRVLWLPWLRRPESGAVWHLLRSPHHLKVSVTPTVT